jgi:hypothetical protein
MGNVKIKTIESVDEDAKSDEDENHREVDKETELETSTHLLQLHVGGRIVTLYET